MGEAAEGLSEISLWAVDFNTTSSNIAGYITAAMLAVALIFVVWALAGNKSNAKNYLIAWFVALIFAIIFVLK